ncbi:hypothetical protein LZ30DRAFT_774540 [Colletotrichum cereale]|nr:hypothetical protein LZ30DRAFT_774540 [Colletotrichum cereale]
MKLSHLALLLTTFAGTNGLMCSCTGSINGKVSKSKTREACLRTGRLDDSGYCVVQDREAFKAACKKTGMKGEPKRIDSNGDRPILHPDPYEGAYYTGSSDYRPQEGPPGDRMPQAPKPYEYRYPPEPLDPWAKSVADGAFDPNPYAPPPQGWWNDKRSLGKSGKESSKRVVRRGRKERHAKKIRPILHPDPYEGAYYGGSSDYRPQEGPPGEPGPEEPKPWEYRYPPEPLDPWAKSVVDGAFDPNPYAPPPQGWWSDKRSLDKSGKKSSKRVVRRGKKERHANKI